MYNSFGETLANEWTPKTVCESRADWLKFEDLSNRDQLEKLDVKKKMKFHLKPTFVFQLLKNIYKEVCTLKSG